MRAFKAALRNVWTQLAAKAPLLRIPTGFLTITSRRDSGMFLPVLDHVCAGGPVFRTSMPEYCGVLMAKIPWKHEADFTVIAEVWTGIGVYWSSGLQITLLLLVLQVVTMMEMHMVAWVFWARVRWFTFWLVNSTFFVCSIPFFRTVVSLSVYCLHCCTNTG